MTRVMFDSVNVNAIPLSGAQLVAGYLDGTYDNATQLEARFPHIPNVHIDVNGSMPGAHVRDWETGDKGRNLEQWVIDHNRIYANKSAVVYCNRSTIPEVRQLTGSQILGLDYWLWQANLDGTVTPIYPGKTVAVQVKTVNSAYDQSLVYLDWWMAPPSQVEHATLVQSPMRDLISHDGGKTWQVV